MDDLFYLAITAAFFALTWLLIRFCDGLRGDRGPRSGAGLGRTR